MGVVQIMPGKKSIPMTRLEFLAEFLGCSMEDMCDYATYPSRVTLESAKSALVMYGLSGYIPRRCWHGSVLEKVIYSILVIM